MRARANSPPMTLTTITHASTPESDMVEDLRVNKSKRKRFTSVHLDCLTENDKHQFIHRHCLDKGVSNRDRELNIR